MRACLIKDHRIVVGVDFRTEWRIRQQGSARSAQWGVTAAVHQDASNSNNPRPRWCNRCAGIITENIDNNVARFFP
jgi:hypothetical protein